ncbi:hypothetical protein EV562_11757 [Streptomyces sp. BK208]|nr:hypothetical protein EV562_11757 [Streptomyces sp. BK208]
MSIASTVLSPSTAGTTAGTDLPAARASDAAHRLGGGAFGRAGAEYVLAPEDRDRMEASGPWAPGGITERLPQAAGPGLWAEPDARTPERPRATYLEPEGDLEGDDK